MRSPSKRETQDFQDGYYAAQAEIGFDCNAVIEECARRVEGLKMPRSEYNVAYDHAAAAIRALKE